MTDFKRAYGDVADKKVATYGNKPVADLARFLPYRPKTVRMAVNLRVGVTRAERVQSADVVVVRVRNKHLDVIRSFV